MQYLSNPDLPIIKPGWQGNPIKDGEFQYLRDPFFPEWSNVMRMMASRNPQGREKRLDKWSPPIASATHWMEDRENNFAVWLGHACFVIQLDGIRYITDPVLQGMPMVPRLVSPPFRTTDIPHVDYILLSHDHRDHVDKVTIQQLLSTNKVRKILAPLEMNRTIGKWIGEVSLEEAGWYQSFAQPANEPRIHLLPARHWSRRGLFDFNRVLWGAFILQTDEYCLYFGGDSAMQWHFADTATLFPAIDLALLPIGAYAPDYMMQGAHMNPEEAVEAWQQLQAKQMIPMHYGTFDLSNEPISEPPKRLRAAARSAGLGDELLVPKVNEVVYL